MKTDFITASILGIFVFLLIVFSSLNSVIFDTGFYEKEFEKLKIYERFGKETVDKEGSILLDYFVNNDKLISSNFYNEKEKSHLADVKNLIYFSRIAFYSVFMTISIMISIIFFLNRKDFFSIISKSFLVSACLTIFFLVFLVLLKASFSQSFYKFHVLFFSNDLWLLNPEIDNLINLFPEKFFYDSFIRMFHILSIFSALFILIGFVIRIKHR